MKLLIEFVFMFVGIVLVLMLAFPITIINIFRYWLNKNTEVAPYIHKIAKSLDQLGNALFNGNIDMTISDRLGHKKEEGTMNWFEKAVCGFLEFLENNHCMEAREYDEKMEDQG